MSGQDREFDLSTMISGVSVWIVLAVAIVCIALLDWLAHSKRSNLPHVMRHTLMVVLQLLSWSLPLLLLLHFYIKGDYIAMFGVTFGALLYHIRKWFTWMYDRYDRFVDQVMENPRVDKSRQGGKID